MIKLPVRIIFGFFALVSLVIFIRLVYFQVFQHQFYVEKRQSHIATVQPLYGNRGEIFDRNGLLLATDRDSISVYANNTSAFNKNTEEQLKQLAFLLDTDYAAMVNKLPKQKNKFIWLRRGVDISRLKQIRELKLSGVDVIKEKSRFYPNSSSLVNVIGFTNIDNKGVEGLEFSFDKELAGTNGKIYLEFDNNGDLIASEKRVVEEPVAGKPIETTIDMRLQALAEEYLAAGLTKSNAKRGGAIVMDMETGEILTMASVPLINRKDAGNTNRELWSNWFISEWYEPGSTLKPLTVGLALDANKITPQTVFEDNGSFVVRDRVIRNYDSDERIHGAITPSDILKYSSNVGAAQVGLLFKPSEYRQRLVNAGFGDKTGIDLPGEIAPTNPADTKNFDINEVRLSNIAFGQGIDTTPLKLMYLMAELLSDNPVPNPHVIKQKEKEPRQGMKSGSLILNPPTKVLMRTMLANVVEEGTGKGARLDNYTVGGKTGTAQKVRPGGGYYENQFVCSFISFMPAGKPKYIVLVLFDEPKAPYNTGGSLCAPIAKSILSDIARLYHLPPDKTAGGK